MILTLDCEGSAELTSDSFDRKLTWAEKIAVQIHCLLCAKSRKLKHQMTSLNNRLDDLMENKMKPALALSDEARQRIADRLAQAENENS